MKKEEGDKLFSPMQKVILLKKMPKWTSRSHFSIIIEQLERLFDSAGLRFCLLSHGPVPHEDGTITLSDKNSYNMELLAWLMSNMEINYVSSPLELINQAYAYITKEE